MNYFRKRIYNKLRDEMVTHVLLVAVVLVTFFPLVKLYYQQDEWLGFGIFLTQGAKYLFSNVKSISGLILGEGRPANMLIHYFFFKYSPFSVVPAALFSIFFHSINAVLVYSLAKRLFKRSIPAMLGSLFFILNSVSQSAVTWTAAAIGDLPSTTLILISLFYFLNYQDTRNKKDLFANFILIYLSLFFKETGIFLFVFVPLASLLFNKVSVDKFIRTFWHYILVAVVIVGYRVAELRAVEHEVALFLTGSSEFYLSSLIGRFIFYPLTSFSLTLVPSVAFLNFARAVTSVVYPFIPTEQFILVAQTAVLDLLSIILTIAMLIVLSRLSKKASLMQKKHLLFWILFVFSSFLPYIIISKNFAYLESRYYYLASAGWAIIFSWIFFLLQTAKKKTIFVLSIMAFGFMLLSHYRAINNNLTETIQVADIRKGFLFQLSEIKPSLEDKRNVFFVSGDKDYYVEGNKVPFQSGFGQLLMVWYFDSGQIPKTLLEEGYLFELGSQGYRQIGDYGYGYFTEKELMEKTLFDYSEPPEVTELVYDSLSKKLILISD